MSNAGGAESSSSMISLQRSMHSSQMYTPGPAISFLTCRWDLPQKLHRSCSFESVGLAIPSLPASGAVHAIAELMLRDDAIYDAVLPGLLRAHEVVALGVLADLLELFAGVLGDDLVEAVAHVDDLLGVDLDIGRLALEARRHLMYQDLGVGQRHALAMRTPGQQQRAHRHRDTDADRLHVGLDELHRVVDRESRVNRSARRVDVQRDVLLGVLGLEVQQLGDDQVGDLVVHGRAQEDDPLVEQAAVDVERPLASRRLLDHHGNKWAHRSRLCFTSPPGFLYRLAGRSLIGRLPQCAWLVGYRRAVAAARSLLGGRPQLLARLGLGNRDGLGALDDPIDGLARRP